MGLILSFGRFLAENSKRVVLKTAFDSKNEDFFRLARKPTDAYFYRLMGGFRSPDGKKAILAKMGFENCPKDS